jgi:hypothetical protein
MVALVDSLSTVELSTEIVIKSSAPFHSEYMAAMVISTFSPISQMSTALLKV